MRKTLESYPESCRDNIRAIIDAVHTELEATYAMILLTAALMDLSPDSPKVAEIILDDYKRIQAVNKK